MQTTFIEKKKRQESEYVTKKNKAVCCYEQNLKVYFWMCLNKHF